MLIAPANMKNPLDQSLACQYNVLGASRVEILPV